MRRLVVALLTALLSLLAAAPAGAGRADLASARAFVDALYAGYVSGNAPPPQGSVAPQIFSPALLRLIRVDQARAGGEVGALDHDPLCACQDFTISRLSVHGRRIAADRARFDVRFDNAGTATLIGLELVQLPGVGWRVSDVHNPLTPSLEAYLRQALKLSR